MLVGRRLRSTYALLVLEPAQQIQQDLLKKGLHCSQPGLRLYMYLQWNGNELPAISNSMDLP